VRRESNAVWHRLGFADAAPNWHQQEEESSKTTAQSLLELFENITAGMTETEINNLPRDGAQEHDHYIYGIPKSDS
jgi:hypothetical protein